MSAVVTFIATVAIFAWTATTASHAQTFLLKAETQSVDFSASVERVDAFVGRDQQTGFRVRLDAVGSAKLAEFSTQLIGAYVSIVHCGQVLTRPRLISPILAGAMEVSGDFSAQIAVEIAQKIEAGRCE